MTATPVSKEEVRLLAIELGGVRKAARRIAQENGWDATKTNQFEDRVCQWSKRHNWFPERTNQSVVSSVSKVSDIVESELAENERETRLSLARASRRMAKDCEELPVRHADKALTVAKTMAIVHKQGEHGSGNVFSLNVLNINTFDVSVEE